MVMELVAMTGNAYVTMDFKGQIVQVILQIIIYGSSVLFKNFFENFDQKMEFFHCYLRIPDDKLWFKLALLIVFQKSEILFLINTISTF